MRENLRDILHIAGILAAIVFAVFALIEIMWVADSLGIPM